MSRVNLHDLLAKQSFDHAVICTFSFQPKFFEDYCLEQFKALDHNNVTVIVDRCVYDDLLREPPADWPKLANLRYLLHPIDVQRVFHPKLFLFASKNKGLLIIGSANLTKPGLTANAELVGVYSFELGKREEHLGLFQQATEFLLELAQRFPSDELQSSLSELTSDAEWIAAGQSPTKGGLRLIHNLNQPLWPQITDGLTGPVDALHVLSRYFDAEPDLLTRVCADLKPRDTVLWTQNGYTTMTPKWFSHDLVKRRLASVRDVSIEDEGHPQPLHAKAIAVVKGKTVRLAFGSANFSKSGLLSTASNGNVEIMLVADNESLFSCKPERLFDPSSSAEKLDGIAQLRTAAREERERRPVTAIELKSASVNDGRLLVTIGPPQSGSSAAAIAVLSFADRGEHRLALKPGPSGLVGILDESIDRLCATETTAIRVEISVPGSATLVSNQLFLVNLRDFETGRGQRRERRIREAQRSAPQFAAMLQELLQIGEPDALKTFLTHCDIPVVDAARPHLFRGARDPFAGTDGLKTLGLRNLRDYESLHDAVMGFCERHGRRMKRHCERASLNGIPNFMHIALAVADVLRSQVQRILVGLEATVDPMTAEEWSRHRQHVGLYLREFEQVVATVFNEYLPALRSRYSAAAIRDALRLDMGPLARLTASFLEVSDRIERCRGKGLSVRTPSGVVPAPVTSHDLIGARRWPEWITPIRGFQDLSADFAREAESHSAS